MARARFIQPDFFDDETLAALPFGARLLFSALWCLADREGRLQDRPLKIAAFVFPYEMKAQKDVPSWLDSLARVGCVLRYRVDGKDYLWVRNFKKYQRPHIREAPSCIPCPAQGEPKASPGQALGEPRFALGDVDPDTDPNTDPNTDTVPGLPKAGKRLADLDSLVRDRLQNEHNSVDVEWEFQKFTDWLDAGGKRFKDYPAAFRNWIRRAEEQNARSGTNGTSTPRRSPDPPVTAEQLYGRGHASKLILD